jgi:succinate dehydrogenase / fumarate reductase cytochrome b subunit
MRTTRVPDPAPSPRRRALLRAFSLAGVVPLGAFLVAHLAVNARALAGEGALARAAERVRAVPALGAVEAALIFAPLLLHALVGTWLVATRQPLATPSPYPPALRVAVRVTGVLALAFLAMHLPEIRFRAGGARPDPDVLATWLAADLSSMHGGLPARAVAYMLGTAVVCFHFAAGLWGFFAATRKAESVRAKRLAAWWAAAVGATAWVLFANVVVYHATGARLFGRAVDEGPASDGPCPPATAKP